MIRALVLLLLAAAVPALLTPLAACAPTRPQPASSAGRSLEDQLAPNWNIPMDSKCRRVVGLRIRLAPDGSVTGTESLEPMPAGDPCTALAESLRRAALLSSPFWFPAGKTPESVVVRFDPETFKAFYSAL